MAEDWVAAPFQYSDDEPTNDADRADDGQPGCWFKGEGKARVVTCVFGASPTSLEDALRVAAALARREGVVDSNRELEVVRTQVVGRNPPISEYRVWILPGSGG
jgi:flavin-binding protein dodecin